MQYGANRGVNFGYTIRTGDASVQVGRSVSGRPQLRERIWRFWARTLRDMFGDRSWFKTLMTRVGNLPGRTIPGLPVSALWLTVCPPSPPSPPCPAHSASLAAHSASLADRGVQRCRAR